jgi:hypothetical protein
MYPNLILHVLLPNPCGVSGGGQIKLTCQYQHLQLTYTKVWDHFILILEFRILNKNTNFRKNLGKNIFKMIHKNILENGSSFWRVLSQFSAFRLCLDFGWVFCFLLNLSTLLLSHRFPLVSANKILCICKRHFNNFAQN